MRQIFITLGLGDEKMKVNEPYGNCDGGGVGELLYSFLTSALHGCEWLPSLPGKCDPVKGSAGPMKEWAGQVLKPIWRF
jgi:hypothetical protein